MPPPPRWLQISHAPSAEGGGREEGFELCARYRGNSIRLPSCFCFSPLISFPPFPNGLFSFLLRLLSPSLSRVAQYLSPSQSVAAPPSATSNYNCVCLLRPSSVLLHSRRRRRERRACAAFKLSGHAWGPQWDPGGKMERMLRVVEVAPFLNFQFSLDRCSASDIITRGRELYPPLLIPSPCRSCVMAKKRCWPETRPRSGHRHRWVHCP